jgi:alginate O-acetyltransferase complex protein AlgI
MLFSTPQYFVFFFVVLVGFYLAPRRTRPVLLLIASYFFYASWNWKFVPLLLALTLIDFFAAQWIETKQGVQRHGALVISLAANLGFLGFFKYYNFAARTVSGVLGLSSDSFLLNIVLPLGISFHTFQSISYVVDVYRRQQQAVRRLVDYALFISFFPQLVAGPIVRAREFFADLYAWEPPEQREIKHGAFLVVLGLVKKVALADNLGPIVDQYFAGLHFHVGGVSAWGAMFAFALQIFFDFSGYTDIAIGSALLLGFHFPINFRRPYLAVSITDFWRRWHISLSSWLRDYLYIPLGGNRHGRAKTYRNLMITMLLGGLWHGANWTFLAWGAFHGLLLSIERMLGIGREREHPSFALAVPRIVLTFCLVCVGWVFFRAPTFADAHFVLGQMFALRGGQWPIDPVLMVLCVLSVLIAVLEEFDCLTKHIEAVPVWSLGLILGVLLFVVEVFGTDRSLPFIYFQF